MTPIENMLLVANVFTLIALLGLSLRVSRLTKDNQISVRIITGIGLAMFKKQGQNNVNIVSEFHKLANADYSELFNDKA
jgi:hypothetical protein